MLLEIFHPSKCYFIMAPVGLDTHCLTVCSGSRLTGSDTKHHVGLGSQWTWERSWLQDVPIYFKMYVVRIICPTHAVFFIQ